MSLAKYDEFIAAKSRKPMKHGFDSTLELNPALFDWQKVVVKWAIKQGRCALFEDCGLGKTLQQLEWARHVQHHTQGMVLILSPLCVADQTVSEGRKFGIQVKHVHDQSECDGQGIFITNYERLDKMTPESFSGVVLDESSILKAFMGKTRIALTESFSNTPYRLCCTATPAPNDFMEFGQHCDFLGVMPSNEMLMRYFINDTMNFGTYRIKGHAENDFWKWVATWAACVSKPSDLGFSDAGFKLPELQMIQHVVDVDTSIGAEDGELFRMGAMSATNIHAEMRLTCPDRVAKAAELVNASPECWLVWCNTNYEADALKKAIPQAVEIRGADSEDKKEKAVAMFLDGSIRVLISKPSIFGFGMNFQHCANVAFVGLSYSFEDFYQALRRTHRFGQKRNVNCHVITAATEHGILATVQRKIEQHLDMQEKMKLSATAFRNDNDERLKMKDDITKKTTAMYTAANADCVRLAMEIETESVDFSVYSPPFASLYIYSADQQDMGNNANDDEFFQHYAFLIKEKLRITKQGCLSAVHCKNIVQYAGRDGMSGLRDFRGQIIAEHIKAGWAYHSEVVIWKDPVIEMQRTKAQGLLWKQLRADSRYSRVGMPEYVLIFRKWGETMKANPVTHTHESFPVADWQRVASPVWMDVNQTRVLNGEIARENADEKHICPLQLDVIERLLRLYTNKGDLVYSPFMGIGSEGYCAVRQGRRFIGSELKESYWKQACKFLARAEEEGRSLFDLTATP